MGDGLVPFALRAVRIHVGTGGVPPGKDSAEIGLHPTRIPYIPPAPAWDDQHPETPFASPIWEVFDHPLTRTTLQRPTTMQTIRHLTLALFALLAAGLSASAQAQATLLHSIPAPPVGVQGGALLGSSVAVDGGFTVAGAPYDDLGGAGAGVVKVFDSTSGALLFVLANPSPAEGDYFGISVAISGTWVVVGAHKDGTAATDGSAYVYDLSSGTPTVPLATLNNPSPANFDSFGSSVAISGTRVVVGARNNDSGATGSAYVYDLSSATPTVPVATRRAFAGTLADYTSLAEVTDANPTMVTQSPVPGSPPPPGVLTVTLTAKDAEGNEASTTFLLDVRPLAAVTEKFLAKGEPVPDRDTLGIPGGPPNDATLASFGVPCIDEDGNISYLAKWTSAAGGKSAGLFHNSTCLLGLGGDAQPVPDAAVKTLGDPVGSADHVALLGTISGVPKSKAAVVFSNASGGRTPLVIAQAGTVAPGADGSLPVGGAKFKTFKAVAIAGDAVAIFAQLSGGTGAERASAANDYGIWLQDGTHSLRLVLREGQNTTIARVTDSAPTTGTTFSVLKDPVFADGDGIAFPATLKATPTVKGLATATLWWKPLFGGLTLVAQGGAPASGLPGSQWKAFTSLAIAGGGRGPIFAATLVPGQGDVTKASASGVWACDFTGAVRLLFRTGDTNIIAGKTLKSFTLLNATRGSTGVTRSFNDAARVVWLATFKEDKSTAIIRTEVP